MNTPMSWLKRHSYFEAGARDRITGLCDAGTFVEWLDARERLASPHLQNLGTPVSFDDGVVTGRGQLDGERVFLAAQVGGFMGGSVGEIHGAKITGLLQRAIKEKPAAVLLLLDSGGVRLHEANAGLVAIAEIQRCIFDVRHAGIPVIALVGGPNGCYGGMGILARCCDSIIMSEEGRLSISGPEVIETVGGVEEFDSRDRALVWRTMGGKHRYLIGEIDCLVDDDLSAFRTAAREYLRKARPLSLDSLTAQHAALSKRIDRFGACKDALDIWRSLCIDTPERIPLLDTDSFMAEFGPIRQKALA